MVRMLDILADYLVLRGYTFQRLDGSVGSEARKKAIEHFNAEGSPDFIFLLSTKAGGLGLNLETADTVIIFDSDWNPQNDLQAMARAHRIGQKKHVNVYRFVSKGTIEEEILDRAKKKMVLEYCIIKQMDTSGENIIQKTNKKSSNSEQFNKEELQAILKFGAQKMFSEEANREKLEEMNLDEILERAEHTDTTEAQNLSEASAEFLEQFKVADFGVNDITWEEIIPEEERKKLEEEEKQEELLYSVRRRTTVTSYANTDRSIDNDQEEEESTKKRKRRASKSKRKTNNEASDSLSERDVRALIKSLQRFGDINSRYDEIVKDADLESKDHELIMDTIQRLCEECEKAIKQEKSEQSDVGTPTTRRNKSVFISFEGVNNINATQLLQRIDDLSLLIQRLKDAKLDSFRLSSTLKPVNNWTCKWGQKDDSLLLVGIYKHGFGYWDKIQQDESLHFKDKFFLGNSQENEDEDRQLPKSVHLNRRAEYLLKIITDEKKNSKLRINSSGTRGSHLHNSSRKNRSISPKDKSSSFISSSVSVISGGGKHRSSKSKTKSTKSKKSKNSKTEKAGSDEEMIDEREREESDYSSMDERDCKERMRPVKRDLKALKDKSNTYVGKKKADFIKGRVKAIGDLIVNIVTPMTNKKEKRKLENHLWKFSTWFWPNMNNPISSSKLRTLYTRLEQSLTSATTTSSSTPIPTSNPILKSTSHNESSSLSQDVRSIPKDKKINSNSNHKSSNNNESHHYSSSSYYNNSRKSYNPSTTTTNNDSYDHRKRSSSKRSMENDHSSTLESNNNKRYKKSSYHHDDERRNTNNNQSYNDSNTNNNNPLNTTSSSTTINNKASLPIVTSLSTSSANTTPTTTTLNNNNSLNSYNLSNDNYTNNNNNNNKFNTNNSNTINNTNKINNNNNNNDYENNINESNKVANTNLINNMNNNTSNTTNNRYNPTLPSTHSRKTSSDDFTRSRSHSYTYSQSSSSTTRKSNSNSKKHYRSQNYSSDRYHKYSKYDAYGSSEQPEPQNSNSYAQPSLSLSSRENSNDRKHYRHHD